MPTEPYMIELRGGRYDGYRQPLDYVPLGNRWEMPAVAPGLAASTRSLYTVLYERRRVALVEQDGLPTMLFGYDLVGSDGPSRPNAATSPVLALLRFFRLSGHRARSA
jgi:hypothetical protein